MGTIKGGSDTHDVLKGLPSVHDIMEWGPVDRLKKDCPRWALRKAIQNTLDKERRYILDHTKDRPPAREDIEQGIQQELQRVLQPSLKRVINATGVILHTNLGRAPLANEAWEAVRSISAGYSNLELNLATGTRGSRYQHLDALLCELTGAEASLVVNNNVAAVFLAIRSIAQGKEVIVSRGELVEIGGSFRIPDILREGGAHLVEVGTTNRTHLKDYEDAITSRTGLLLKVHPSNYRVAGFSCEVSLSELVGLGRRCSLPVMHDLGSGCLLDLRQCGPYSEPAVRDVVHTGADLVTFSGDKLLGGPQAGIMLGGKEIVERMHRHPLHRALRVDKMTVAAMEATLRLYLDEQGLHESIPIMKMLSIPAALLEKRARRFKRMLDKVVGKAFEFHLAPTVSRVGGGSLPIEELKGMAVEVSSRGHRPEAIMVFLRSWTPPIVARVDNDRIVFDMRTLFDGEEKTICSALEALSMREPAPPNL